MILIVSNIAKYHMKLRKGYIEYLGENERKLYKEQSKMRCPSYIHTTEDSNLSLLV